MQIIKHCVTQCYIVWATLVACLPQPTLLSAIDILTVYIAILTVYIAILTVYVTSDWF